MDTETLTEWLRLDPSNTRFSIELIQKERRSSRKDDDDDDDERRRQRAVGA